MKRFGATSTFFVCSTFTESRTVQHGSNKPNTWLPTWGLFDCKTQVQSQQVLFFHAFAPSKIVTPPGKRTHLPSFKAPADLNIIHFEWPLFRLTLDAPLPSLALPPPHLPPSSFLLLFLSLVPLSLHYSCSLSEWQGGTVKTGKEGRISFFFFLLTKQPS